VTTLRELSDTYGRTWGISTDLAYGVAAWRHAAITQADYQAGRLHSLLAWDLDELARKLAEQDRDQRQASQNVQTSAVTGRLVHPLRGGAADIR
jgi:hypothetical protein